MSRSNKKVQIYSETPMRDDKNEGVAMSWTRRIRTPPFWTGSEARIHFSLFKWKLKISYKVRKMRSSKFQFSLVTNTRFWALSSYVRPRLSVKGVIIKKKIVYAWTVFIYFQKLFFHFGNNCLKLLGSLSCLIVIIGTDSGVRADGSVLMYV